jgi:hypothetical protein
MSAEVLRNEGNYDLKRGEANPVIFEELLGKVFERFPEPVMFEPFAGHTGRSKSLDFADDIDVKLIAYDMEPSDFRVDEQDSTKTGPNERIHGALFHPPYFGTGSMSSKEADLSNESGQSEYVIALGATIKLIYDSMVMGGLVAAVGRDYRHNGQRIRLDQVMLFAFYDAGFKLTDVWLSEPDVVLIFER